MAKVIFLKSFRTRRTPGLTTKGGGELCAIEQLKEVPFKIKRVFYIFGLCKSERGGHRHKKTRLLLICVNGSYRVDVNDGKRKHAYFLNHPTKGLLLEPEDWHTMQGLTKKAVLLVLASEFYNSKDYIDEEYQ